MNGGVVDCEDDGDGVCLMRYRIRRISLSTFADFNNLFFQLALFFYDGRYFLRFYDVLMYLDKDHSTHHTKNTNTKTHPEKLF